MSFQTHINFPFCCEMQKRNVSCNFNECGLEISSLKKYAKRKQGRSAMVIHNTCALYSTLLKSPEKQTKI